MNKTNTAGNPQKIIFNNYITDEEWETGVIHFDNKLVAINDLTREFRVKSSKLSEDVLAYIRAHLLSNYKGNDIHKILVTIPTCVTYEEIVLNYAISIFIEVKNQYKSSTYDDQALLNERNIDIRKKFGVKNFQSLFFF